MKWLTQHELLLLRKSRTHRQYSEPSPSTLSRSKKRGAEQAIGRSRGGLTTKIHAAVDALGNPVRLLLSAGQKSDIGQSIALIEGFDFQVLLGDKGYDAQSLEDKVVEKQAVACIPSRKNCKVQRDYDKHLYKERNLVERFFNLLKHFRRIATRYEKTDRNYLAMAHFASAIILLR